MFDSKAFSLSRGAIHELRDAVFLKDRDLRYVYVNRAYLRLNNLNAESVIGSTAHAVLPDQTAETCHRMDQRVIATGRAEVHETTHQISGPGFMRSHITLTPSRDARGNIIGLMGIVRDITAEYDRQLNSYAMEQCLSGQDTRPLIPICSGCRAFRSPAGAWFHPEIPAALQTQNAYLTHSLCQSCSGLFTD